MNNDEKLLNAVRTLEQKQKELARIKKQLQQAETEDQAAEKELIRIMKALGQISIRYQLRTYALVDDGIMWTEFDGKVLQ